MYRLPIIGSVLIALVAVAFFTTGFKVVGLKSKSLGSIDGLRVYEGKPFTGAAYAFYLNRHPARVAWFWRGRQFGTEVHWYSNGQRWIERKYAAGRPEGTWKSWYPDGSVKALSSYSNGALDGESWAWRGDGEVAEYIRSEKGVTRARKFWLQDGVVFHNYLTSGSSRIGIIGGDFCKLSRPNGSKDYRRASN